MKTKFLISLMAFSIINLNAFEYHAPKNYPSGELGKLVKLGEQIILHTNIHPLSKDLVGNNLRCANCHLIGKDGKPGTSTGIGTYIGTATAFPAYSNREKTVQTLQDRIANCFMRSMNGKRPVIDSKVNLAITAYITWLSTGMPIKMNEKVPCSPLNAKRWVENSKKFATIQRKATHKNYLNGKKLFAQKCAMCHGKNGEGNGMFPPLWGNNSYNAGAGMSKLNKGAAWVQSNMPYGQGNTLTDQEAADIMLYVNAQPRPDFVLKEHLLPKCQMGYYNSKVLNEKATVRSNFKAFGLDIDKIRGDHLIK